MRKIPLKKHGQEVGFIETDTWGGKFIAIGEVIMPRGFAHKGEDDYEIWAIADELSDEQIEKLLCKK